MADANRIRRAAQARLKALRRALWRWVLSGDDLDLYHGQVVDAPRGIDNGVAYAQPALLPGYVRRQMSESQVTQYITEVNNRQSFRFQFDTPQRSALDYPVMPAIDDPLCEWDKATREQVLSNCHAAAQRDPLAKAAVGYTKGFVVGNGMRRTYQSPLVEDVLEAFAHSEHTPVDRYEKEFVGDLMQDGELICQFVDDGPGEIVLVPRRPWEVTEIHTEPGFIRRPTEFCFQFQDENPHDTTFGTGAQIVDVPAADVLHVAINKNAYELRGRPELFVALPWLRAYREWLEDRARQNYWRNALLWDVAVDATNPAAVASVVNQWRKPPAPGSVYAHSSKIQVNAVSNNVGAADAGEDGRQMKLAVAAGLRLPEYFFSDGSNANLATTSSQELPALTTFADLQQIMINQVWRPVFRRVLQANIDAGLLPGEVRVEDNDGEPVLSDVGEEQWIDTLDAFEVSYEPINSADPINVAQALTLHLKNGLVSKQTAASEAGFDWRREQRLMAVEEQQELQDIRDGLKPAPPVMRPETVMNDGDEDEQAQQDDMAGLPNPEPDAAPNLTDKQEA